MRDELITYETAILAKEKGFDIHCEYFYSDQVYKEYYRITPPGKLLHIGNVEENDLASNKENGIFVCPT